jgi:hypothetical protein
VTCFRCVRAPDVTPTQRGERRSSTSKQRNSDASKEVGVDVNAEKTKYMLLSRHHNTGQNHNIKIATR